MRRVRKKKTGGWGGARPGAGRKPRPENIGLLPHAARPPFDPDVPVLVTKRTADGAPSLRDPRVLPVVLEEIAAASERHFRVVHSKVDDSAVVLIAEARDAVSFARGMQRIGARIARRVNMLVGRTGRFWHERYAREDLGTARARRQAIALVRST